MMKKYRKTKALLFPILALGVLAFGIGAGCGDDDGNPAGNGGNGGGGSFVDVSSSWVGVWRDSSYIEFTVQGETFSFSGVDTVTICPEMPVDSAAGLPPECTFTWNGNTLTVHCTMADTEEGCTMTTESEYTQTVTGNGYSGTGTLTMTYGSNCGDLSNRTMDATYTVIGVRLGDAPDPCEPNVGPPGTGGGQNGTDPPDPSPGEGDFTAIIENGSPVNVDFSDADVLVFRDATDNFYNVNAGFDGPNGFNFTTPSNTATGTYGLSESQTGNQVGVIVTDPNGFMTNAGGTITFTVVTASRIAATFEFDMEIMDASQSTIEKTVEGEFDLSVDFTGKAPDELLRKRVSRILRSRCPNCP